MASARASNKKGQVDPLEDFLGKVTFDTIQDELDELGVSAVIDFRELDKEGIYNLASNLKKVHTKKFRKKWQWGWVKTGVNL